MRLFRPFLRAQSEFLFRCCSDPKLTSRVFWLGSEQATYGDRFQTSRGRNIVAAAPARQASPQVPKLTIHAASCDIPPN